MKSLKRWTAVIGAGLVMLMLAVVALPAAAAGIDAVPTMHREGIGGADDTYLADALGITADELQAAHEAANQAAIQQALDEGLITEAQAEALLEGNAFGRGFRAPRGFFGLDTLDHEALLANALGITTDELQAAKASARDAMVADAVAEGRITQEQADMMQAQEALRSYLDEQGLQDSMRSLYADAVQQAVDAGVITQDQADAILSSANGFGKFGGMRGDFHGRGGMHGFEGMRGRDGRRGFGTPSDSTPSGLLNQRGVGASFLSF